MYKEHYGEYAYWCLGVKGSYLCMNLPAAQSILAPFSRSSVKLQSLGFASSFDWLWKLQTFIIRQKKLENDNETVKKQNLRNNHCK